MSDSPWPMVRLGEVLERSEEWITIDPEQRYRQITVRLWGKGVVQRDEVDGTQISGRRLRVRTDEFIISRIDARNGACGLIPPALDGGVVTNDFPVFKPDSKRLSPKFLDWMSKTDWFVELCKAASEGSTNRVRLKEERFRSLPIPLPPLAEQQRIVARIEELAAKVEEARRLNSELAADRRRMLLSAYEKVIVGAMWKPMKDVAPLVRRPVAVAEDSYYYELGIRSFGRGTFHKPALTGMEVGSKKLFNIEPGDLVFNIVFAWEGAVAVSKSEDAGRVGSHRFLTCVPKPGVATASFLSFHFLTERGLQQLGDASPGGAGRNRTLAMKSLGTIEVPLPAYERQLWFDQLERRISDVAAYKSQTDSELEEFLPAILGRAFHGEL